MEMMEAVQPALEEDEGAGRETRKGVSCSVYTKYTTGTIS